MRNEQTKSPSNEGSVLVALRRRLRWSGSDGIFGFGVGRDDLRRRGPLADVDALLSSVACDELALVIPVTLLLAVLAGVSGRSSRLLLLRSGMGGRGGRSRVGGSTTLLGHGSGRSTVLVRLSLDGLGSESVRARLVEMLLATALSRSEFVRHAEDLDAANLRFANLSNRVSKPALVSSGAELLELAELALVLVAVDVGMTIRSAREAQILRRDDFRNGSLSVVVVLILVVAVILVVLVVDVLLLSAILAEIDDALRDSGRDAGGVRRSLGLAVVLVSIENLLLLLQSDDGRMLLLLRLRSREWRRHLLRGLGGREELGILRRQLLLLIELRLLKVVLLLLSLSLLLLLRVVGGNEALVHGLGRRGRIPPHSQTARKRHSGRRKRRRRRVEHAHAVDHTHGRRRHGRASNIPSIQQLPQALKEDRSNAHRRRIHRCGDLDLGGRSESRGLKIDAHVAGCRSDRNLHARHGHDGVGGCLLLLLLQHHLAVVERLLLLLLERSRGRGGRDRTIRDVLVRCAGVVEGDVVVVVVVVHGGGGGVGWWRGRERESGGDAGGREGGGGRGGVGGWEGEGRRRSNCLEVCAGDED